MADTRNDSMRATNTSLTPPEQDLQQSRRDYPPTERERVPVDSGGTHAPPTYAGGPGDRLNPDVDPAAPAAAGPLVPAGDEAARAQAGRPRGDARANPGDRAQSDFRHAGGDEWIGTPQDLAPGALTTNPDGEDVDMAPGALTTNGNAPSVGGRIEGDPANVPAGARASQRSQTRDDLIPAGRTRTDPGSGLLQEQSPQITHEPKDAFPPQHQGKPGLEYELNPRPRYMAPLYKAAGKLEGKVALVTGGDSGIGRAVSVLYAREGADVAIVFLPSELTDAQETQRVVEEHGQKCLLIPGDLTDPHFCKAAVEQTRQQLGGIDILVSNAGYQNRKSSIEEVTEDEFDTTFKTNVYAYYRLAKAAVPHMKPGSAIIATSSETGLEGNKQLPDYSATKGAINAFTKALAQQLAKKGIRVNAVAPGPVWTPLNPADLGMDAEKVSKFGSDVPLGRPAQPEEIAPAYVFLASDADSSYITGIVLAEMGGTTTAG